MTLLFRSTDTHAVVFLDLQSVFELLLACAALGAAPLQGHPGHARLDQPGGQRQRRQGAHGVEDHFRAEATGHRSKGGTGRSTEWVSSLFLPPPPTPPP